MNPAPTMATSTLVGPGNGSAAVTPGSASCQRLSASWVRALAIVIRGQLQPSPRRTPAGEALYIGRLYSLGVPAVPTDPTQPDRLNSAVTQLFVRLRDHLVEQGTSVPQARVLSQLRDRGPTRVTELAAVMQVSQPTMTAQVQRLEQQHLVERTADASDGRAVRVALTTAGRATLGAIVASRSALLQQGLDGLDVDDRAAVVAAIPALQRLADALERAGPVRH